MNWPHLVKQKKEIKGSEVKQIKLKNTKEYVLLKNAFLS